MKPGDRVQMIALPPKLAELNDPSTHRLFEQCLGRTFRVIGFQLPEGLPIRLAELHVGQVLNQPAYKHSIWVEEEYLRLVD